MQERKIFIGFGVLSFLLLLVAIDRGFDRREGQAEPAVEVTEAEAAAPATDEVVEEAPAEQVAEATEETPESEPAAEVAEVAEQDSTAQTETATEETVEAEPVPAGNENALPVGRTAVFAEGAVRVFVARIDAENAQARLSINGGAVQLGAGEATLVTSGGTDCSVMLNAVTPDGAELSAVCGDDLAEPAGISVGETEILKDGQLRVFASKVHADGARVSINGDLVHLPIGATARTDLGEERCHVTLSSVDRGHASVEAICMALPPRSDFAGPGRTALLTAGEMAARVFVSAVDTRNAVARVAVNGLDTMRASSGDGIRLENGCEVVIEEISDGQASFSMACIE